MINRELTPSEKDKILELNSERINKIRRLPWRQQQKAADKFTVDINMCLLASKDTFLDLTILAHEYLENNDKLGI